MQVPCTRAVLTDLFIKPVLLMVSCYQLHKWIIDYNVKTKLFVFLVQQFFNNFWSTSNNKLLKKRFMQQHFKWKIHSDNKSLVICCMTSHHSQQFCISPWWICTDTRFTVSVSWTRFIKMATGKWVTDGCYNCYRWQTASCLVVSKWSKNVLFNEISVYGINGHRIPTHFQEQNNYFQSFITYSTMHLTEIIRNNSECPIHKSHQRKVSWKISMKTTSTS